MEYTEELYHHGVKGQKWGIRKKQKTSLRDRGAKFIQKLGSKKVATIVASSAAVTSGVLWVASAFVPGVAALNTAAAAANMLSVAAAPK